VEYDEVDQERLIERLWSDGYALGGRSLDDETCAALVRGYADDARYRSTVTMQAHGFGRGEYRYFAYPLPAEITSLRDRLYGMLAPVANAWNTALGASERYPPVLGEYLARCHAAGQLRPTPLVLSYGAGDYNCLHQDVYGELAFPLQVTVPLSARSEYAGGESVFVQQRPRAQSRASVALPERGQLLVFANRYRPVRTLSGFARSNVRHGVADVRSGTRFALGLIFHDAL